METIVMNLNDKQKKVLEYLDGQSLVIACPGSGKTTTMIARANALIQKGVPEEQILVITFTKNAAESMKKKYQEQYGNTNINFGTIHALCFQILREMQGYVYENILKELDKWNFFYEYAKKYYKNMNANDREELFRNVFTEISFVKNADIPLN